MKWFVLQVMTGEELECRRRIEKSGIRAIVPTRIMPELHGGRWREREIVMLVGYVFVQCSGSIADYYRLSAIPGAIRILPGRGVYHPVPERQMAWMLELAHNDKAWEISRAEMRNGKIHIISGPLLGKEHEIRSWDRRRRRAKIGIRILDETRMIDVGLQEMVTSSC